MAARSRACSGAWPRYGQKQTVLAQFRPKAAIEAACSAGQRSPIADTTQKSAAIYFNSHGAPVILGCHVRVMAVGQRSSLLPRSCVRCSTMY